jgi:sarcosine reductase
MRLELLTHRVREVVLGERTTLDGETLVVDARALRALLLEDSRLRDVRIDVARPGESCRIVHVMDVLEPRAKIDPPGPAFPGVTGPPTINGTGRTRRLAGATVVLASLPPSSDDPSVFQEAVIDMVGPAADACPFSRTANVVLSVVPQDMLAFDEATGAMRRAAARAAEYLAEGAGTAPPDEVEAIELLPAAGPLPRVALVLQLEAWGSLQRSFLYGQSVDGLVPTLLHPNEVLDGALTCGTYHQPAIRHFTYLLQDHALIRQLYRRHGVDVDFVGVVVQRALWAGYDEKRRSAEFAAKLLRHLNVNGAVVTFAHGGHAITDLVLTCEACQRLGVKVVSLMFEMAGEDGFDFGLVQGAADAEPMVSTGNAYALISIPEVERTLGGDALHGLGGHATARHDARGPADILLGHVAAASGPTGWGRLTTRAG